MLKDVLAYKSAKLSSDAQARAAEYREERKARELDEFVSLVVAEVRPAIETAVEALLTEKMGEMMGALGNIPQPVDRADEIIASMPRADNSDVLAAIGSIKPAEVNVDLAPVLRAIANIKSPDVDLSPVLEAVSQIDVNFPRRWTVVHKKGKRGEYLGSEIQAAD